MAINLTGLLDEMQSHAAASGHFERINRHEPKNAPDGNLTAAIWVQSVTPTRSGLASTTVVVTFTIRLYQGMLMEPQDMIDPNLIAAADDLMAAFSGDFELGGTVRNVDLLGESGAALSFAAGYLNASGTLYRVLDVIVPVIINDVWSQSA